MVSSSVRHLPISHAGRAMAGVFLGSSLVHLSYRTGDGWFLPRLDTCPSLISDWRWLVSSSARHLSISHIGRAMAGFFLGSSLVHLSYRTGDGWFLPRLDTCPSLISDGRWLVSYSARHLSISHIGRAMTGFLLGSSLVHLSYRTGDGWFLTRLVTCPSLISDGR